MLPRSLSECCTCFLISPEDIKFIIIIVRSGCPYFLLAEFSLHFTMLPNFFDRKKFCSKKMSLKTLLHIQGPKNMCLFCNAHRTHMLCSTHQAISIFWKDCFTTHHYWAKKRGIHARASRSPNMAPKPSVGGQLFVYMPEGGTWMYL